MRYSFTEEQQQLRDTIRRFLDEVSTSSNIRTQMETPEGFDRKVWKRLHDELGIGGIHISSMYGGAELSFVELSIVLEEMGRALFCSPYLSSCVFATSVIESLGTEDQKNMYLPSLISGETIGTVAQYENKSTFDVDELEATVVDGALSGSKALVTDGGVADVVLVLARDGENGVPAYFLVDTSATGIECRSLTTVDWTRKLSELKFFETPAHRLGSAAPTSDVLDFIFNLQLAALANEMVGGAGKMLDSAVEYANTRVQFGRSISSFQTIKHKCADLLLHVEFAKSAAYHAAQAIVEGDPHLGESCSLAKAVANDAYTKAASDCIQIHGGIGFTWENDTHLWFKRAKSSEVYLGNTAYHRERYLTEKSL